MSDLDSKLSSMNLHSSVEKFQVENDKPLASPTISITEDQIKFFQINGFLTVSNLVPKDEITHLVNEYDIWFKQKRGRNEGNFFDLLGEDRDENNLIAPQMLWPSKYGFNLYQTILYANAYHISKLLLGESTKFKGDHAICKFPSEKSEATPWHQDEAYWDSTKHYEALGVWIALQEVNEDSGCMEFLPRSHTIQKEVLAHRTKDNNPLIHGLQLENPQLYPFEQFSVKCPIQAGSATFHHCRTLHYTGPNKSKIIRRAYTLSFESVSEVVDSKRVYSWNSSKKTLREERARNSGWTGREP